MRTRIASSRFPFPANAAALTATAEETVRAEPFEAIELVLAEVF